MHGAENLGIEELGLFDQIRRWRRRGMTLVAEVRMCGR
jgi:hypothetical protein